MTQAKGARWVKTEKKKAYWVAKKAEAGRLQAQQEHEKRKPLTLEIKQMLKEWLKKVDPVETAAIIGGTVVVHEIIFKTAEFVGQIKDLLEKSPIAQTGALIPLSVFLLGPFAQPPSPPLQNGEQKIELTNDLFVWLIAFGISYYAVRHGGDLLSIASMFFAKSPTT